MSEMALMYHVYLYSTTRYKCSSAKVKILSSRFGSIDVPKTSTVKYFSLIIPDLLERDYSIQ